MPLPEGFDWRQPAPGYEKAWGGMRPSDMQSTWEYVLGQEGRQEADAQQAMQSLMNAPAQQQAPAQQVPQGGLMSAPPTPAGMGIGSGQKPGSLLDILMQR